MEHIVSLMEQYLDKAMELERNRQPGAGLLGIGTRPADDPCHEKFVMELQNAARQLAQETQDPAKALAAMETILYAAAEHEEPLSIYWTLIAAQGSVKPLIPLLTPGDAARLHGDYGRKYRPFTRMPVQKEIMKALQKQAKTKQ